MKFTFKFLLANGKTELYAFTANDVADARANAGAYAALAFGEYEVMDFYLV